MELAGVWIHHDQRRVQHGQLDHAAEEKPRRRRTHPRQNGARKRQSRRAANGNEGLAASIQQGHARGQGGSF